MKKKTKTRSKNVIMTLKCIEEMKLNKWEGKVTLRDFNTKQNFLEVSSLLKVQSEEVKEINRCIPGQWPI